MMFVYSVHHKKRSKPTHNIKTVFKGKNKLKTKNKII